MPPDPHTAVGRRGAWLGLALMLMTLLAYWPAIHDGGFIWDDDDYVYQNKTLLDAQGLKDIWTDPQATPQYYPLVHTGYWLEYRLWGLDPTGYHVTNVLLHALAAILLWRLLRSLTIPGAWLAAALFALHPLHVESVAWITERKNVLSGVFYLTSAWFFLKWADADSLSGRRHRHYFAALLFYVFALLSKTVTASLPAAILLVFWWRDGRLAHGNALRENPIRLWLRGRVLPLLPFFAIGLALSLLTVWLEKHHVGADGVDWDLSLVERCLIAGRALWFYLAKLMWPVGLCFNYPRWDINAASWWQYLYPFAYAALLAVCWLARQRLGRGPLVAFLFFAGSLFPALGFFDVYPMRYSFVADHFAYLANIGVLVLVAAPLDRAARAWLPAPGRILAPALLLLPMALLSWKQCDIYRGQEELWQDTIRRNPQSFMAHNNLGQMRLHQQRPEEALPLFRKSLRINPRQLTAINNLGVALAGLGRIEEAEQQYRKAIEVDPRDPQAYVNLGALKAGQGQLEEAVKLLRIAVRMDPGLAAAHTNLGIGLAETGRLREAIQHFEKALAIDPGFAEGHLRYGEALHAAGRIREAADQYRLALAAEPALAAAHNHLGAIAASDQLIPAAVDHFHRALETDPSFAPAHHNLAKVLVIQGRIAEAGEYFRRAAALAPASGRIRFDFANFLAGHGDKTTALQEFLAASTVMPEGGAEALYRAAVLEQQLGDPEAAAERFRTVIQMAPGHTAAHNHLAVLLASRGSNQEAAELLQRAVELDPANAELHNNLGVILVRAGRHPEARVALEAAVRLKPDYAEARKNLDDLKRLMNSDGQP